MCIPTYVYLYYTLNLYNGSCYCIIPFRNDVNRSTISPRNAFQGHPAYEQYVCGTRDSAAFNTPYVTWSQRYNGISNIFAI